MKKYKSSDLTHKRAEVLNEAANNGVIIQQLETNGKVRREFILINLDKYNTNLSSEKYINSMSDAAKENTEEFNKLINDKYQLVLQEARAPEDFGAVEDDKVCIIFDDDSYFVVKQQSWSDGDVDLVEHVSDLNDHDKLSLKLITQQQFDDNKRVEKQALDTTKAIQRKMRYLELKKEFGDL